MGLIYTNKINLIVLMIGAVLSLSQLFCGCRNDFVYEEHYQGGDLKKDYSTNWVNLFGNVDPVHDWNMAENVNITLTVDSTSFVQVFAKYNDVYRLVGEFVNVIDSQTLSFDVVDGTTDIIVTDGERYAKCNVFDQIRLDKDIIENDCSLDTVMMKWRVACEDLGDLVNYDFNDQVFEFEKVLDCESGNYKLVITPLCAGGILAAHYGWNNIEIGEIHENLRKSGSPAGSTVSGDYYMININAYGDHSFDEYKGRSFEIDIPIEFSFAKDMGVFWVIGDESREDVENSQYERIPIMMPKIGAVPQMILLPDNWRWTQEIVSIYDAYPGFADWNKDKKNVSWLNNPIVDKDKAFFYYELNQK